MVVLAGCDAMGGERGEGREALTSARGCARVRVLVLERGVGGVSRRRWSCRVLVPVLVWRRRWWCWVRFGLLLAKVAGRGLAYF